MSTNALAGFETPARTDAPTKNRRVTARIVRDDDGATHTVYRVSGRAYGSVEALKTALGDQR